MDRAKTPTKVLLVGYNGANNTGSESRLLSIISEVRSVLGPEAEITVPTLNERNLRRYVTESETLRIAPIPAIYFSALRRLVKGNDLIMLVEGSCYMDTWAKALLWAFLSTSKYASEYRKPCLAYAVDAGKLSKGSIERVRRDASKTDLIVTRTQLAADRLKDWGVRTKIEVTDDTAFTFDAGAEQGTLRRLWPEAKEVAGMAVVDFHIWPVVIRPIGRRQDCYRWPYYFSRSPERRARSEELASNLAREADRLVEEHGHQVALIAMEALDECLARSVLSKMRHPSEARVFSSNEHAADVMTRVLRDLHILITSRYHASVLSMQSGVPQVAVGHDLRLRDIYQESGLLDEFFLPAGSPDLWPRLSERADLLIDGHDAIKERMLAVHQRHLERAKENVRLLRRFCQEKGLPVV